MTNEEIKELIDLVMSTGVAELEVQRGDNRVRIRRGASASDIQLATAANQYTPSSGSSAPQQQMSAGSGGGQSSSGGSSGGPPPGMENSNMMTVKSPIVGTYYDAPSPSAPPFVKPGDVVQPGQVLCIIESMKLMNEIEAEVAGTIVAKLVENGRPVEYGEALFTVRPR